MKPNPFAAALAAAMLVLLPPAWSPLHAQEGSEPWFRTGTIVLGGELGGVAFTDFQRSVARSNADPELGDFMRRVSARTTVTGGGSVSYWFRDGWAVRAALGYAPSGFSVWNEPRAQRVLDARVQEEPATYANLGMWFANAALLFRVPARIGPVVPYGIAGGGVVEYRSARDAELPPEARRRFDRGRWRGLAAVFGAGLAFPLQRPGLLMNFELTNHLTRTPLDDEGRGEWFELGGSSVQLERDPDRGTDGIGLASNLRLTVGLSLAVRHRRSALPDQDGASRLGGLSSGQVGNAQDEHVPAVAVRIERQVQRDGVDVSIGLRAPRDARVRLRSGQAGRATDPAGESREQAGPVGGLQRELDAESLGTRTGETINLSVDAERVARPDTEVRPRIQDRVVAPLR